MSEKTAKAIAEREELSRAIRADDLRKKADREKAAKREDKAAARDAKGPEASAPAASEGTSSGDK